MVPFSPQSVHNGSSLKPNLCKFVGVRSVSYTDLSMNEMQKGSNLHRSPHVIFLMGRSHLVHAPWDTSSFLFQVRTSSWIMALLSLDPAFPQRWAWEVPRPCHPVHVVPMMSRSFNILSACATDDSAAHLRPDLVRMPACLTCSSWEFLYDIMTLHFATLNSSTTDDRGSCSCPDLM